MEIHSSPGYKYSDDGTLITTNLAGAFSIIPVTVSLLPVK